VRIPTCDYAMSGNFPVGATEDQRYAHGRQDCQPQYRRIEDDFGRPMPDGRERWQHGNKQAIAVFIGR
jgi:hypothetical protein